MTFFTRVFLMSIFIGITYNVSAQNDEMLLLQRDYPKCIPKFPVDNQSATYIFAIDFSTSMQILEPVVKKHLEIFINSLPDGDRVTIIREGETNATDFIYIPNAVVNRDSRGAIINNLNSIPFNESGSDGYQLAEKILDAVDQTGGNELIYIFIFTDFEYYTTTNGYNKDACDWERLTNRYSNLMKGKQIVKTGLELKNENLKPQAIFKTDLNKVFKGVQYYQIVDGGSLANWFIDTRANILRDRLKFVVTKRIQDEIKTAAFHVKPVPDGPPECTIECNNCNIIKSFSFLGPRDLIAFKRPLVEWPFSEYPLVQGQVRLIFADQFLHPKGYNEIDRLAPDFQKINVKIVLHQPDAYLPWYVALVIILILLGIVVCVLITCFSKKTFDTLRVNASWRNLKNNEVKSLNYNNVNRLILGRQVKVSGAMNFPIQGVNKQIEIFIRHRCPCKFWIKPGVYLGAVQGSNFKFTIPGQRQTRNLMAGSEEFVAPLNAFSAVSIEFEDNSITYLLQIRK